MTSSRAIHRALQVLAGAGVAVFAAAIGVAAAVARVAVTPARRLLEPVTVTEISSVDGGTLVWLRGDEGLPGQYTLRFSQGQGWANLGPMFDQRDGLVARKLRSVRRGVLQPGVQGELTGWWFAAPEEFERLNARVEHVVYETELGPAWAWLITPRRVPRSMRGRWAVHVHGRGGLPEETLRGVGPMLAAGISNLVISYRNDPGAPVGMRGRYGNGVAERHDVDAAIAEVIDRGAKRVVLFGWSMGGTASLLAATQGEHRDVIDGLVLDSPAIHWRKILEHHAGEMHVPSAVASLGIAMIRSGLMPSGVERGINFDELTPDWFARHLRVPVLLLASESDEYVPCEGAVELARLRPDLVELRLVRDAGHVRLWNVDPDPWELAVEDFALRLPDASK